MADPILSVLLGIPAYGGLMRAETAACYLELGHALASAEDRFRFAGVKIVDTQPIDRVRNMLLEEARALDVDWLLMIDADCWVRGTAEEPAGYQLLRMISEADRRNAVIVGPHVWARDGREIMTYQRLGSRLCGTITINVSGSPSVNVTSGYMHTASAISTSIMAINVKRLPVGFTFKFADVSEDLFFCRLVEEADQLGPDRILVDGRVHTSHMGRPAPRHYDP